MSSEQTPNSVVRVISVGGKSNLEASEQVHTEVSLMCNEFRKKIEKHVREGGLKDMKGVEVRMEFYSRIG